jgi:hypothetical protein
LEGGFYECSIDLWALLSVGMFLQECFQVANYCGAIVAGFIDGLLELLVFGGLFCVRG